MKYLSAREGARIYSAVDVSGEFITCFPGKCNKQTLRIPVVEFLDFVSQNQNIYLLTEPIV